MLRATELRERLKQQGIDASVQTLRNYARGGMEGVTRDDKGHLFDPEKAVAWIRSNKTGTRYGGKRRNSGRPKKVTEEERGMRTLVDQAEMRAEIAEREKPPVGAITLESVLFLTLEELRALAGFADLAKFDRSKMDFLESLTKVRKAELEHKRTIGSLVDADDVRQEWGDLMARFRSELEAWVGKLAPELAMAAGAGPDRYGAVRAVMDREIERVLGVLAG